MKTEKDNSGALAPIEIKVPNDGLYQTYFIPVLHFLQNCPTFTDDRFFSYSEEKYYNESQAEGRLEYLP